MGLAPLPEAFAATREALHRVAEQIVAPARKPHNEIALTPTPGGFGTPPFEYEGRALAGPRRRRRDRRRRGRRRAPPDARARSPPPRRSWAPTCSRTARPPTRARSSSTRVRRACWASSTRSPRPRSRRCAATAAPADELVGDHPLARAFRRRVRVRPRGARRPRDLRRLAGRRAPSRALPVRRSLAGRRAAASSGTRPASPAPSSPTRSWSRADDPERLAADSSPSAGRRSRD